MKKMSFDLLTYNICFDGRGDEGDFTLNKRIGNIATFIRERVHNHSPHILCFQEVLEENILDIKKAAGKGYKVFTQKYNRKGFNLVTLVPHALTRRVRYIEPENGLKRFLTVKFKGLTLVNIHHPVAADERKFSHKCLVEYLEGMQGCKIVCGDFNSFDRDFGVEMMRDLAFAGFYDGASYLLDPLKRPINFTFEAYPSDRFLGDGRYPLDHICISKGLSMSPMIAHTVRTNEALGRTWCVSDHYACTTKIQFA